MVGATVSNRSKVESRAGANTDPLFPVSGPLVALRGSKTRASKHNVDYVFQFGAVWRDLDLLLLGAWLTINDAGEIVE